MKSLQVNHVGNVTRVTGKHSVSSVQTRAQRRAENVVPTAAPDLDSCPIVEGRMGNNGPLDDRPSINNDTMVRLWHGMQTRSQTRRGGRHRKRGGRPILERTAPVAIAGGIEGWNANYLTEKQLNDPDIGPALAWIGTDGRPPWETVKSSSPAMRALWQQYESLIVCDNVLYRIFHRADDAAKHYQLVLPSALKVQFLEWCTPMLRAISNFSNVLTMYRGEPGGIPGGVI